MRGGARHVHVPCPNWTVEENATLAKLVADGLSSGQIAKLMGKTRNAIIGRCSRMRLTLKGKGGGYHPKEPKPETVAVPPTPAVKAPALPLPPVPPKPAATIRRMHDVDLMKLFGEANERPIADIVQPATGLARELGIRVYTKAVTPQPVPGQSGELRASRVSLPYVSILGAAA